MMVKVWSTHTFVYNVKQDCLLVNVRPSTCVSVMLCVLDLDPMSLVQKLDLDIMSVVPTPTGKSWIFL